jgi:MFS family permease
MFFSCNVAFSSMPVFLPTILNDMGYHSITSQALTAPPYFFSFIVVLLTAYYSDRLQSRSAFIIFHSILGTLGYGTIALCGYLRFPSTLIRYLALYPAAAGFFSAITIIITWTINNQESETGRGAGVAIMNVIGQMGPLVGTSIFPKEDGPEYVRGMAVCAGFMAVVGVLAGVLRWVLVKENNRNKERGGGEYAGVPLEEGGMGKEKKGFEYII